MWTRYHTAQWGASATNVVAGFYRVQNEPDLVMTTLFIGLQPGFFQRDFHREQMNLDQMESLIAVSGSCLLSFLEDLRDRLEFPDGFIEDRDPLLPGVAKIEL